MTREEKEKAIKCLKWFREYNEEDYCAGDRIKDKYDDLYYLVTEQDFEIFDMIIGWLEQDPKTDYKSFCEWVASEIFTEDWELNKDSFAEIACRKLSKLGIVASEGDVWTLKKSEVANEQIQA